MWLKNRFIDNIMFCSKKLTNLFLTLTCFTRLMDLIIVHNTDIKKCSIERNNKIYIWNELHSIVVV